MTARSSSSAASTIRSRSVAFASNRARSRLRSAPTPRSARLRSAREDDERGGLRLVAYIVAPDAPAVEELRAFLGETLPDYMIPSAFRTVEALPLTRQRQDRPSRAGGPRRRCRPGARRSTSRRATRWREAIAEIWGELLGRRAGGRAGRLLRARRPLAARDAGDHADPPDLRRRSAASAARSADRRRSGRGDSRHRSARRGRRRGSVTGAEPLSPAKRALLERALLRRRESSASQVTIARRPDARPRAAVVRPAADVVPRPVGARRAHVQRRARAAAARSARS